jgi:hypothetical protein
MSEADVTEIVFRWITDEVNWPDNVCYKIAEKVSRIVYEKVSRKQFLLIKNYTKCFLFIRYGILINHFPNPYLSITIVVKVGQTLNCLIKGKGVLGPIVNKTVSQVTIQTQRPASNLCNEKY